jgi:hypothetical protein
MGLGEVLFKLGTKPTPPRDQGSRQAQSDSAVGDFVSRYLKCLGINDLSKVPDVLRGVGAGGDAVRCIEDLMRSASWNELFTKVNLEIALLEAAAKREVQRLTGSSASASNESLALSAYYSFVLSICMIRQLLSNESTRPVGLITLAKITYLLFDLYMELSKRKLIPPNLEVEFWRVREVLVNVMEELFKGDRTMTVHDKSLDGDKQLR